MAISIDSKSRRIALEDGREIAFDSPEAFEVLSALWMRCAWETKYVYTFTWFGRPIIQVPDDMFRVQEVLYRLKPDVVIETGVAHGGSLVYYASLFEAMKHGRVIGVDIEIRPHNRKALDEHELRHRIELIEADAVADATVAQVRELVAPGETAIVFLDSNHSYAHVLAELEAYAPFVSVGSYIVATDGIMGELAGAPRSAPDWTWNNPKQAAHAFVAEDPLFVIEEPAFPFNEGVVTGRVTYWPDAFIKRIA